MKQKIKIIIGISVFMLFIKTSNAQSFLTQDKLWSDYYYTGGLPFMPNGTTWHKVGADTIIEGTVYNQILYSTDSLMENWYVEDFMREEGNKVFQYDAYTQSEYLLYDFGMQPGDTLFDRNGLVATVLQSVCDTVMDKTRKIFTFSKYAYDSSSQEYNGFHGYVATEVWIEGIGALRGGLFRPLYDYSTGGDYSIGYRGLICYFEGVNLIYHYPDFDRCYYNGMASPPSDLSIPDVKAQLGVLTQNIPNPFTVQTEIKYYVANGVKEAYICIYDMQGKMLKKISAAPGQNSIMIQGSTLAAGMYLYSLVVDGQEIDAKRMILTK